MQGGGTNVAYAEQKAQEGTADPQWSEGPFQDQIGPEEEGSGMNEWIIAAILVLPSVLWVAFVTWMAYGPDILKWWDER